MPLVVEELNPASLKAKEVATEDYVDTGLSEIDVSYAALTDKDQLAIELGYANYADMQSAAVLGSTVINGGHLNTELIEVGTLHGDAIIGGTIAGDKIIGNTITGDHIAASTIMTSPRINGGTIVGGLIQGARIEGSLIVSGSSDVTVRTEAWTDTFDALAYQSGVEEVVNANGVSVNNTPSTEVYSSIKSCDHSLLSDYFRYKFYEIHPKVKLILHTTNQDARIRGSMRVRLKNGGVTILDTGNCSTESPTSGTGFSMSHTISATETGNSIPESPQYDVTTTLTFDFTVLYSGDGALSAKINGSSSSGSYIYYTQLDCAADDGV